MRCSIQCQPVIGEFDTLTSDNRWLWSNGPTCPRLNEKNIIHQVLCRWSCWALLELKFIIWDCSVYKGGQIVRQLCRHFTHGWINPSINCEQLIQGRLHTKRTSCHLPLDCPTPHSRIATVLSNRNRVACFLINVQKQLVLKYVIEQLWLIFYRPIELIPKSNWTLVTC